MGNYKAGSDVDLALKGMLEPDLILQVSESLNENHSLPYFDAYGKSIYSKK